MNTMQDYSETVTKLEQLYSSRKLKFTSAFEGYAPMQAYGYIDDERFYFRERGGAISLITGKYNREDEENFVAAYLERQKHNHQLRNAERIQRGIEPQFNLYLDIPTVQTGKEKEFYPHTIHRKAVIDNNFTYEIDNPFGLTWLESIFSYLIDNLQPVK
jgi:hypothetical protein